MFVFTVAPWLGDPALRHAGGVDTAGDGNEEGRIPEEGRHLEDGTAVGSGGAGGNNSGGNSGGNGGGNSGAGDSGGDSGGSGKVGRATGIVSPHLIDDGDIAVLLLPIAGPHSRTLVFCILSSAVCP